MCVMQSAAAGERPGRCRHICFAQQDTLPPHAILGYLWGLR